MNASVMKTYGIDINTGVSRFLGDEKIYKKILTMFLKDDTFIRVKTAYKNRDYVMLFKNAHELKGVSGNAAFTDLYNSTSALVEFLRGYKSGDSTDDAAVDAMFSEIERSYKRVCDGVNIAIEE